MTRAFAWTKNLAWAAMIALFIAGIVGKLSHHSQPAGPRGGTVVDSARAGVVRDSLDSAARSQRHRADSLDAWIDSAPADTVVRYLRQLVPVRIDDPARAETVLVEAPLVRGLADSLTACHVQRDSLTGAALLWQARDAAHAEAYRIAQDRPVVVGDTSPPSRATWAAVGAAGALVGVTTILLLGR